MNLNQGEINMARTKKSGGRSILARLKAKVRGARRTRKNPPKHRLFGGRKVPTGSKKFRPVLWRLPRGKGLARPSGSRIRRPVRINPVYASKRRKSVRRNPGLKSIGKIFSVASLMPVIKLGGGFVAGGMAMPVLYRYTPESMKKYDQYLGIVHVLLGGIIVAFVKNKTAKEVGIGIASSGVYDLVAKNVTALELPALPRTSALVTKYLKGSYNPMNPMLAANYRSAGELAPAMAASYSPVALSGTSENPYSDIYN